MQRSHNGRFLDLVRDRAAPDVARVGPAGGRRFLGNIVIENKEREESWVGGRRECGTVEGSLVLDVQYLVQNLQRNHNAQKLEKPHLRATIQSPEYNSFSAP